jgi:hypothetical protein
VRTQCPHRSARALLPSPRRPSAASSGPSLGRRCLVQEPLPPPPLPHALLTHRCTVAAAAAALPMCCRLLRLAHAPCLIIYIDHLSF